MPLYAAIDLHSTNSVLAVLDETDKPLRQCRLPNDLTRILAELEPFRTDVVGVAVESTYNWYWLVDGLADHGYPMKLVNTTAVPQYDGLKYSGDESDARHLAHLMRLGILPVGYIYPRAGRMVRDLLRQRAVFVHQGTSAMQRVQGAWARYTGQCLSANAFRQLDDAAIRKAFPDVCARLAVQAHWQVWQGLHAQACKIEKEVLAQHPYPAERTALCSVPGIGPVLGLTITLETGDIARFADAGNYVSYCRLVKSERVSNGKRKGTGNRRCGNPYLCWAWIEAANFATRYAPAVKRWYDRKAAKRHRIIAIKAVAHKLARAGYYLMRDGGKFEVTRAFG